jgi:hypothetical protein
MRLGAAADLNELLDIGNFGRHDDGCGCFEARYKRESSLSTCFKTPATVIMPAEVSDIKQFIEICRRKDASCMLLSMNCLISETSAGMMTVAGVLKQGTKEKAHCRHLDSRDETWR